MELLIETDLGGKGEGGGSSPKIGIGLINIFVGENSLYQKDGTKIIYTFNQWVVTL